jgi:hypothetical protein
VVAGHIVPQLQRLAAAGAGLQAGGPGGALLQAAPTAALVGYAAFLMHHHQLLPPALLASAKDCMLWVLEQQGQGQGQGEGEGEEPPAAAALVCSSAAGLHLAPWLLEGDGDGDGADADGSSTSAASSGGSGSGGFLGLCRGILPVRALAGGYLRHGSRQQWCAFLSGALRCGSGLFVVERVARAAEEGDLAVLTSAAGGGSGGGGGGQQAAQQWEVVDHRSEELAAVLGQLVRARDVARLGALLGLLDAWWPLELWRCSRRRLVQGGLQPAAGPGLAPSIAACRTHTADLHEGIFARTEAVLPWRGLSPARSLARRSLLAPLVGLRGSHLPPQAPSAWTWARRS